MEDTQTDTVYTYEKSQTDIEENCTNENTADLLLNGCDDDDPLDLMDHCDDESIGSNSDVWKGSDSEDEKEISNENLDTNIITYNDINNVTEKNNETQSEIVDEFPALNKEVVETETSLNTNGNLDKTKEQEFEHENHNNNEESKLQHQENEKETETKQVEEEEIETTKSDDLEVTDSLKHQEKEIEPINVNVESDTDKSKQKESDGEKERPANNESPIDVEAFPDKDPLTASQLPLGDFSKNDVDIDDCQMDYDAEEDDDFDPSLLCPEVSMDVEENPVITTNCSIPQGANNGSPLPYEPLFSTYVDDVTGAEILFNLNPEEFDLRKRLYGLSNPVQTTKIHCTACNVHLGSALEGQNNRFVHPLLKVLICKDCYHFYTSGEFEKDEDGSELYCRWCGQGGQVLCCSKCEFVFCKRCIRTNFGRRKMFEIRDSDSWDCFRCNLSQIMNQRVQCYEFFEYIRREMAHASTEKNPEHWSKDYTRCCVPKKHSNDSEEIKKIKKRKEDKNVDPDYNPVVDTMSETNSTLNIINANLAEEGLMLPKPIKILPKPIKKDNDIEFVRQINPPQMTVNSRPAFRSILPTTIRPVIQPTVVRISAQPVPPPLVPTNQARILSHALQGKNSCSLKHDWFDKTVKAAARVNSHLSYTLTQLNRAQNQAGSVEELAVVHNKLQEILSSSINSLIQIRKNLRTEFISGIKTVKLPPKKRVENFANDDDVICVTPPSVVLPMPAQDLLAITKKDLNHGKPKSYLKVKSVKDLQNISADCITIPDDTPPPQTNRESVTLGKVTKVNEDKPGSSRTPTTDAVSIEKVSQVPSEKTKKIEDKITKVKSKELIFIVKNQSAQEIRKMMSVKIKLVREDLQDLQKKLLSKRD